VLSAPSRKGSKTSSVRIPRLKKNPDARLEAALIAVHPRTGAILAMVGGRDYGKSQYNRVTDARRQPGSIFKPIVYLAALGSAHVGEAHVQANTFVLDEPFTWEYERARRAGRPPTTRTTTSAASPSATRWCSRSTPRLHASRAKSASLPSATWPCAWGRARPAAYPAIVLGSWEVTPLEVARVYGVLANAGSATVPLAISKVMDREGQLIEGHRVAIERTVPAADAYLVTHLLEDAIDRGTGRGVRALGFDRPAAGKTGTTNDYNDAWFAGYTPDLLTVVWVGFDRGEKLGLSGGTAAVPIWTAFMKEALEGQPRPRLPGSRRRSCSSISIARPGSSRLPVAARSCARHFWLARSRMTTATSTGRSCLRGEERRRVRAGARLPGVIATAALAAALSGCFALEDEYEPPAPPPKPVARTAPVPQTQRPAEPTPPLASLPRDEEGLGRGPLGRAGVLLDRAIAIAEDAQRNGQPVNAASSLICA
jgi:membrane peptidoglycan carboxypeptidase